MTTATYPNLADRATAALLNGRPGVLKESPSKTYRFRLGIVRLSAMLSLMSIRKIARDLEQVAITRGDLKW